MLNFRKYYLTYVICFLAFFITTPSEWFYAAKFFVSSEQVNKKISIDTNHAEILSVKNSYKGRTQKYLIKYDDIYIQYVDSSTNRNNNGKRKTNLFCRSKICYVGIENARIHQFVIVAIILGIVASIIFPNRIFEE